MRTVAFLFNISRTNVYFYVDNEHLFCYIIEKNKCLKRGEPNDN